MFSLGWRLGGEAWVCRRQLWVWEEEMVRECQTLLSNFSLQVQSSDSWQWQPDLVTCYSVRGAYQLLTSQDSAMLDEAETLILAQADTLEGVHLCMEASTRQVVNEG
ncbi:hypothetical protein TSUD_325650 [Trifolium subterraneum]|uniref:Uncharacterized protein n=1 Tax=Trifolium subterraneum TaxID=3900 RepID=A0A2Z6M945_TRISU|nr:hypothetical protein TSUD_325650 [Trifolium subterraneum]